MVHGSACGKVILLGEHAVVYGVPAIVLGIDRGATARATAIGASARSELTLGSTERVTDDGASDVARAFAALLRACAVTRPVRVEVTTELPAGAGLGCSAALGVAIARALDAWEGRSAATASDAAERAMAWEKVFHGNPSGIDATAAARGGCLLYQKMNGGLHLNEIALAQPLTLAIGHSGVSSSTREMVDLVAKLKARSEENVTRSFEAIHSLVQNARLALEAGDHVGLGKLMDLNQVLLSGLMVSTEEIETMCRLARESGALGAKLTGSGGGGCVVALVEDDPAPVSRAGRKQGFALSPRRVASARDAAAKGVPCLDSLGLRRRAPQHRAHQVLGQARRVRPHAVGTEPFDDARRDVDHDQRGFDDALAARPGRSSTAARRPTERRGACRSCSIACARPPASTSKARVESANDFPTASGLASSASGFAALVVAAAKAAALDWDAATLSDQARRSSVSAARSIFGGFATLAAGVAARDVLVGRTHRGIDRLAGGDLGGGDDARSRKTSVRPRGWRTPAPRARTIGRGSRARPGSSSVRGAPSLRATSKRSEWSPKRAPSPCTPRRWPRHRRSSTSIR